MPLPSRPPQAQPAQQPAPSQHAPAPLQAPPPLPPPPAPASALPPVATQAQEREYPAQGYVPAPQHLGHPDQGHQAPQGHQGHQGGEPQAPWATDGGEGADPVMATAVAPQAETAAGGPNPYGAPAQHSVAPVPPPAPAPMPLPPAFGQPPAPAPMPAPAFADTTDPFGGYGSPDSGLSPADEAAAGMLLQVIGDDESTEIIINGPAEVLQKVKGQRFHIPDIRFSSAEAYHAVLNDYVLRHTDTRERIDGANISVEGQMELPSERGDVPPMLARVHMLCPPLVPYAKVTIAKKARWEYDLDGIAATGAMTPSMAEFLKVVGHGRLTCVVSGPTGAGKTTLLQAMTRHFDQNDRIIVIEDTPELRLPIADVVYLCSTQPKPGLRTEDVVTTEWLVKATQRMRMDRVIVGECRGAEMAEWLIAANSGAEGSCTTVHADNPRRALDKILGLATKSPTAASETTLRREIAATVDIVVQAGLIDGRHVITHIEEVSTTIRQEAGLIATQTLFEFNRSRGRHEVRARPSEDLVNTLRQRGVTVHPGWFANSAS